MPKTEKIYTKILRIRVMEETFNWLTHMSKTYGENISKLVREMIYVFRHGREKGKKVKKK